MRRVLIVALSLGGFGLFASGVHGLTQVDGQLAGAVEAPRTIEIKRELEPPGDCPWREPQPDPPQRRL